MKHAALIALLVVAPPVAAHPHIFIDTGLEAVVDEHGQLTHIKVTWGYDALFSLLITEDRQMDMDGDGALTAEEEAALTGFDMQWIEGYNGDLVAWVDGKPLVLSGPMEGTATMVDGQIITTHLRAVEGTPPVVGATLSMKPYDPTYYNAYDVTGTLGVIGYEGCTIDRIEPDIDNEMRSLQILLGELSQQENAEDFGFPEVGETFATEVRIACAGS